MMLPKIFRLFAIFLVSANNLFGYFNNTISIESDSLKSLKSDFSYKDDRLEIDKYGNVIKDLDKGVMYVQYLNSSTSELYPYGNITMPTTNFFVDEIRFTDGAVMKYKYDYVLAPLTKNQLETKLIFKPVHLHLEHNNRIMVALDRQGDYTIANGKDLYSVNFTGGRAIPDLRTTDSFFYEFTEPDPKKRPKVLVQEAKDGITVNFNYDHLYPLFNYEDYLNQRRPVPKHDSLEKGYYFNGNVYKLKAMITRNMFGMQYKIENNAMRVNETYDYFPNRNAQKMPEGLHDFSQIDVFDKIEVFNAQSKGFIEVAGSFNGEYYAETEMYIVDGQNRKIWLGRDANPSKMFLGKNETPKIDSNCLKIKILLDVKQNFRAIHNGSKTYSINEWNKKMREIKPMSKFTEF